MLQDMIGDLSNRRRTSSSSSSPTIQTQLNQLGPKVERRDQESTRRGGYQEWYRQHRLRPGDQLPGEPNAGRALGFTPQEVAEDATAILDGLPAQEPMIVNGRPYTVRVRLPDETRASLDAMQNTVFNSASGHTASLGSLADVTQLPPQNEILRENLQRYIAVTGRLEGSDLGTVMPQ